VRGIKRVKLLACKLKLVTVLRSIFWMGIAGLTLMIWDYTMYLMASTIHSFKDIQMELVVCIKKARSFLYTV